MGTHLWHAGLSTSGLFWYVVTSGHASVFLSQCWTRVSFQSGARMGAEHEEKSQGLLAGEGKVEEESFSFMPSSVPGAVCEWSKLIRSWVIAPLPLRRQVKWRISSQSKIILLRKLYFQNCFKGNFIADLGHTFRTTTCVCVCVCVFSRSAVSDSLWPRGL